MALSHVPVLKRLFLVTTEASTNRLNNPQRKKRKLGNKTEDQKMVHFVSSAEDIKAVWSLCAVIFLSFLIFCNLFALMTSDLHRDRSRREERRN